jgi:hypothetical protein
VAGCCEHGTEPSGSIKDREFLGYLSALLASQKGLCCAPWSLSVGHTVTGSLLTWLVRHEMLL